MNRNHNHKYNSNKKQQEGFPLPSPHLPLNQHQEATTNQPRKTATCPSFHQHQEATTNQPRKTATCPSFNKHQKTTTYPSFTTSPSRTRRLGFMAGTFFKRRLLLPACGILLGGSLLLGGCGAAAVLPSGNQGEMTAVTQTQTKVQTQSGYFTDRDREGEYDGTQSTLITLSGNSTKMEDASVKIEDGTITLTREGTYILRGEWDGSIVVDAEENAKVQIVLDTVTVTSRDSAALYVKQADKVFVTLAEGSENLLVTSLAFSETEEGIDGTVYAKDDLTINGKGSLTVRSTAYGIVSNDDLKITGGNILIEAEETGLKAHDALCLADMELELTTGGDGIHAENTEDAALGFVYIEDGSYTIQAGGDGISATGDVQIDDGEFAITTGEGCTEVAGQNIGGGNAMMPFPEGTRPERKGGENESESGKNLEETEPVSPAGMSSEETNGERLPFGGQRQARSLPDGAQMPPEGLPDMGERSATLQSSSAAANTASASGAEETVSQKGIKADGTLTISDGIFYIESAEDAVHTNTDMHIAGGTFTFFAADDAMHVDGLLEVTGGTFTIQAAEGMEGTYIRINDGSISITATDDGINAANKSTEYPVCLEVNGGDISISMGGGDTDAMDSNGDIVINGGNIDISAQFAFDFDGKAEWNGGTVKVNGATVSEITNSMRGRGQMW